MKALWMKLRWKLIKLLLGKKGWHSFEEWSYAIRKSKEVTITSVLEVPASKAFSITQEDIETELYIGLVNKLKEQNVIDMLHMVNEQENELVCRASITVIKHRR